MMSAMPGPVAYMVDTICWAYMMGTMRWNIHSGAHSVGPT